METTEWDIQSGETAKAFHAFSHYRDMPPADRSIDTAHAEHLALCEGRKRRGKRGSNRWQDWSAKHDWVSRAAAHDADLSRKRRDRRARELEEAQDRAAKIAHSALDRLEERLKAIDVEQIPAAVLDRWLKTLTDVELKALGHQDKVALEHSGKDGGPIQQDVKFITDALNNADTRDALDALSRRLESQPGGDSG